MIVTWCGIQDEQFELFRKASFEAAVQCLRSGSSDISGVLLYRMVTATLTTASYQHSIIEFHLLCLLWRLCVTLLPRSFTLGFILSIVLY